MESRRLPWPALVVSAVVLALMAPALLPNSSLMTFQPSRWEPWHSTLTPDPEAPSFNADHARFVLPRAALLRRALAAGELPLWDPHAFLGGPFVALWQTQVLYPPNLALMVLTPRAVLAWTVALHMLIAGLGMLALGRALGLARPAALLAGVAYAVGGHTVLRMGHPSFIATLAWLPLCLLGVERFFATRRGRWLASVAVCWALLILAGQATLVVFCGYFIGAWVLVRTLRPLRPRMLAALAGALLAGSLLASPQLLASHDLAQRSGRNERNVTALERSTVPAVRLAQVLAPEAFGSVVDPEASPGRLNLGDDGQRLSYAASVASYAGSFMPGLALVGLVAGSWSGRRTLLALAAVVALLLASGSPLFRLAYAALPGFRFSMVNRALPLFTFAVLLLAARGAHVLMSGTLPRRRTLAAAGAWLLAATGVWFWLRSVVLPAAAASGGVALAPYLEALDRSYLAGGVLGTGLIATAAFVFVQGQAHLEGYAARARAWQAVAVALLAGELLLFALPFRAVRPRAHVFPVTPALAWLAAHDDGHRFVRFERPRQPPREAGGRRAPLFEASLGAAFGLREVGGFAPMHDDAVNDFLKAAGWSRTSSWSVGSLQDPRALSSPLFPLLSARWVVTPPGLRPAGLEAVYRGDLDIWEHPAALPPAFLAGATVRVNGLDEALERLQSPDTDLRRLATVEGAGLAVGAPAAAGVSVEAGDARLVARGFNRIEVETSAGAPAWLVVTETWAPGWTVRVDNGKPFPSVRTDGIFQGAAVASGRHRIVFSYRPDWVRHGALGAGAGAALLAGLLLAARRRGHRRTA